MTYENRKKILATGIVLMLATVTFIGCTEQETMEIKPPTFDIKGFIFEPRYDKDFSNVSSAYVSFSVQVENPNDDEIQVQFLYCIVADEYGNALLSFSLPKYAQFNCIDCLTSEMLILKPKNEIRALPL